jgi:primosomal protein N'
MEKTKSKTIQELKCKWCGYSWYPRKEGDYPKQCPKCKVYKWDTKRKSKNIEVDLKDNENRPNQAQEVKKPKKSLFDDLI